MRNPEDDYTVTITDTSVSVEYRNNVVEIAWKDIETVSLINTDQGPFEPDVWLVLKGKGVFCQIPQMAKGYDDVYEIVSRFENFNFENVIASMGTTENAAFLLWSKNPQ